MFDYQPSLSGELLDLRPAQLDDFDALLAVASDPLIWAMHPAHDRWQEPVFRIFFADALADRGGLVAVERMSKAVIGFSRYSTRVAGTREVEIGWTFLARRCWGAGFNAEMKRLMLAHAFRFVDTVLFLIGEQNWRSRHAVEKLGARLTDRAHDMVIHGVAHQHLCYVIDRPE
jgi:RimJ/RimL family protein N-acetyltransferase